MNWLLIAAALVASGATGEGGPPRRVRSVAVEANATCPPAVGDEVVVCYRADEPYRIPKRFRQGEPSAGNQSWVSRAALIDDVSRMAGGLPNTCSPIGTGGWTGCTAAMLHQWTAERRAAQRAAESVP